MSIVCILTSTSIWNFKMCMEKATIFPTQTHRHTDTHTHIYMCSESGYIYIYIYIYNLTLNSSLWMFLRFGLTWRTERFIVRICSGSFSNYLVSNRIPDNKVHGANMGPTWVLSSLGGPHVGPMKLAIWDGLQRACYKNNQQPVILLIVMERTRTLHTARMMWFIRSLTHSVIDAT